MSHQPRLARHLFHRPIALVMVVAYEIVAGFLEVCGGMLLYYHSQLIANGSIEDPPDKFLTAAFRHLHLTSHASLQAGIFLGLLGLGKFILALALWYRIYVIREIGILLFGLLGLFGLAQLVHAFTWFELLFWVVDVLVLLYFWKVLPKHFALGRIE